MFEDTFSQLYEKNRGIKVIGVWGKDGLELEKRIYTNPMEISRVIDLEFSGAELADIITKLDRTKAASGNFMIKLNYHNHTLNIRSLTKDYFLILLTGEDFIEGKFKFYLDLNKERLTSAL